MAIPQSREARLFYRCAIRRYDDAQILYRADRNTGAVYLAGYGVECILKALILQGLPQKERRGKSFKGQIAHDYESLRTLYLQNGGARFPLAITKAFTFVNSWGSELRYSPSDTKPEDAQGFLSAAQEIIDWAKGRF